MSLHRPPSVWSASGPLGHLSRPLVLLCIGCFALIVWYAAQESTANVNTLVKVGNEGQLIPGQTIAVNASSNASLLDLEDISDIDENSDLETANREQDDDIEEEILKAQEASNAYATSVVDESSSDWSTCDLFDGAWELDESYSSSAYDPARCRVEKRWNCPLLHNQTIGKPMKYEQYRWKPHNCNMPTLEQIAQTLKPDIRILVLGDSMLLNQYASLNCLVKSRKDLFGDFVVDSIRDNFLVKCLQGQAFRGGIDKSLRNIILTEPSPFLIQQNITSYDIILLGAGHHYGVPPEVVYEPPDVKRLSDALIHVINTVYKTLFERMGYTGVVIWQGYPPRHFQGGDWNSGGKCVVNDSIDNFEEDAAAIAIENAVRRGLQQTQGNIKHLNITYLSMSRKDSHPGAIVRDGRPIMDCSHFCLPGVPDLWNTLMLSMVPKWMAEQSEAIMEDERRSLT